MKNIVKNQKGFTLIELVLVLILIGILASFAIAKSFTMADAAGTKAYIAAADELNAREKQAWGIAKMQGTWTDDAVFAMVKDGATAPDLGSAYVWAGPAEQAQTSATEITFKDATRAKFRRYVSTTNSPGRWVAESLDSTPLQ